MSFSDLFRGSNFTNLFLTPGKTREYQETAALYGRVRAAYGRKNGQRSSLTMAKHEAHQLDLGFAFTFYKIQGATLQQLILDLNFCPARMATFSAVYVGLTRVTSIDNLRLLPVTSISMSRKLRELAYDPNLRNWIDEKSL